MKLVPVVSLLSVLGFLPTVYCISDGDLYFTEYFDPNTGKAAGTLSCTQDNEVLDIRSVEYYYRDSSSSDHRCTYRCPALSNIYLDGTHSVCQNENNIRSTCYARNSCSFNNIIQPQIVCSGDGGDNIVTHVRINYRCIDSDYVFNLCEEREMIVTKQTQIILTSPLSSDDTYRKLSCKCVLSSRYTNQPLNQNVTLTRVRMFQLRGGDVVTYGYGYQQTTYSTQYHPDYLPTEIPIPVGQYNSKEASVELNNTNPLAGDSRVFVRIEPGKDIKINCNDAKVVDISTTSSVTALAASTTSTTRDKLNTSVTESNVISTLPTDYVCGCGDNSLLLIVIVIASVLALLCTALVITLCVVRRYYQLQMRRLTNADTADDRETIAPESYELLQQVRNEPVYRQIEQTDRQYDEVRADNYYSEPDERPTVGTQQDDDYIAMEQN